MKAKEMFEKLGYEIDIDSAHISYLFKNKEYPSLEVCTMNV